jgi:Subtilase family
MPRLRHLFLQGTAQPQPYVSTAGGSSDFKTPPRDERIVHGERLADNVRRAAADLAQHPEPPAEGLAFVPLIVKSDPNFRLMLASLDNKTLGLQLVNVRIDPDGREIATIHIPKDSIPGFIRKFQAYAHDTNRWGNPPNASLAESITELGLAMLRGGDYWMDAGPLPTPDEQFWWEVWLRDEGNIALPDDRSVTVDIAFREQAGSLNIRLSDQQRKFPDYVVILAYTSLNDLCQFPSLLRYLGELRRASIVPTEFIDLSPAGQTEFINAMLERTTFAGEAAPAVCILDRGVNRGHPLLEHALAEEHNLAWIDDWTSADRSGHGTEMAGLALYGPKLGELLLSDRLIPVRHRLEAVKILPDVGANNPPDYGPITIGSVAKL